MMLPAPFAVPPVAPVIMTGPTCIHCGDTMQRGANVEDNMTAQWGGVALFLVGLAICFTGFGIIIGIPLMIMAARMGHKKRHGWKCPSCGYFFEAN